MVQHEFRLTEGGFAEDLDKSITEFLRRFGIFIQSYQLYSPENENMKAIIRKLRDVLAKLFQWRNPIALTISNERLYFEELPIKSRMPLVIEMIDLMLDRLVQKVIIYEDVENWELFSLIEVLNTQPVKLRDAGGPQMMLTTDLGVKNISFQEVSVDASDEVLEAGSWKSTVQKAGLEVKDVIRFMQGPDKQETGAEGGGGMGPEGQGGPGGTDGEGHAAGSSGKSSTDGIGDPDDPKYDAKGRETSGPIRGLEAEFTDRSNLDKNLDEFEREEMTRNRFLRREIFQLIELLQNPNILAQMVLELASVDTEEGTMIDPAELLRIVTRTENTLLFRSSFSHDKIESHLSDAMQLLDKNVRVAVLGECLRRQRTGVHTPNMRVYNFTPPEYAEAVLSLCFDEEGRDALRQVVFTPAQWEKIRPHFNQLYAGYFSKGPNIRDKIAARLLSFKGLPETPQYNVLQEVLNEYSSVQRQDILHKRLVKLQSLLPNQIEIGYANTILGLLQYERDDTRIQEISTQLFEQVRQLASRQPLEAAALLARHKEIVEGIDEKHLRLVSKWIEDRDNDFLAQILEKIGNIEKKENRQAFIKLLPIMGLGSQNSLRLMLDKCYFESVTSDVDLLVNILENQKTDVIRILSEYLNEHHINFSLKRFLKGLSLYLAFAGTQAEDLVGKCLEASESSVGLATLIRIARSGNPKLAVPIFRDVLWGSKSKYPQSHKIVAVYGLGLMNDLESADKLRKLAERSPFVIRKSHYELRIAAMYSFARLKGEDATENLPKIFKKIRRSEMGVMRFFRKS